MDYLDGFSEGHESQGVKLAYRALLIVVTLLSVTVAIMNVATLGRAGHHVYNALVSLVIIGLLIYVFVNVGWYRKDNQAPKHKWLTFLLIGLLVLLDVAMMMAFVETIEYKEPAPPPPPSVIEPSPAPTTPAPTPAPNASTFVFAQRRQLRATQRYAYPSSEGRRRSHDTRN